MSINAYPLQWALACALALLLAACGGSAEPVQPDRATTQPVDCGGGIACK